MVRQKRRAAPRKRRNPPKRHRTKSQVKPAQAQTSGLEIFDKEIDSVWTGFANECKQFAGGFNAEIGGRELDVDASPHTILVKYSTGAELLLQLDRDDRHVSCWMNSGSAKFGSCIVDQAPVALVIQDGRLRWVFNGRPASEEELAVRLLTDLTGVGE